MEIHSCLTCRVLAVARGPGPSGVAVEAREEAIQVQYGARQKYEVSRGIDAPLASRQPPVQRGRSVHCREGRRGVRNIGSGERVRGGRKI
ncbi:hypothetical protein E2C01_094097 [Portunus trituberculatus]|uniref:Uncharacterized protein n=1 Tax=Portunus trituberculatus TaxID=210409 RepID=A0A5B7JWP9_PORTR|nr:hypothetical protein [Portunus trituberculatus]